MGNKKKIGIITILHVNNYGAELQAFSLQYKLKQMGYDSEIINYLFYKNPKFKSSKKSQPFIKLTLKQKAKEFLYPYYKKINTLPYKKQKDHRDKKFQDFHDEYTDQTKEITTIDELYSTSFDYDIYIVGSDQVWNPGTNTNIEPYFLTFAPKDKLKIAFASSFGVDKIDLGYKNKYKSLLNNLDFIGVREQSGVNIVDSLTEKQATLVLDPTFLLDKEEWLSFSTKTELKKPYLLMYVLTDSDYMTNIAKTIAKEKKLQIVRICKNAFVEDKSADVINIIDAGPKEYLGLFSKASFVLTTSFHGTCFSLNFNIPFYTILKKNKVNNSRQIDLLEYLGIGERILFVGDKIKDVKKLDINYSLVNEKLELKKEISINFLKKALKK